MTSPFSGEIGNPLGIPTHSVDVVLASNLLEHLSEQQCSDLFDRLDEVLKERGKLILIQPNYYYCYPFSFKSLLPKSYWVTKVYLSSFWRPLARQMLIVAER
jgi:hypothetical protein